MQVGRRFRPNAAGDEQTDGSDMILRIVHHITSNMMHDRHVQVYIYTVSQKKAQQYCP